MSKRINVILSDETINVLDRITTKGTRSTFISRAVLHYIETQGGQALREKLAEGYRANRRQALEITAEWFPLEEEAAQTTGGNGRTRSSKPKRR